MKAMRVNFRTHSDYLTVLLEFINVAIRTVTYEYLRAICTALSRDGKDY